MSAEIVAVLVIPADRDPGRLVQPGPCASNPPAVLSGHVCAYKGHQQWQVHDDFSGGDCYMCQYPLSALPLWWDGALVPEGWTRLLYAWVPVQHRYAAPLSWFPELGAVIVAAQHAPPGLVSRVVLLARDAGGCLVEVSA